jgi:hypothetical protein
MKNMINLQASLRGTPGLVQMLPPIRHLLRNLLLKPSETFSQAQYVHLNIVNSFYSSLDSFGIALTDNNIS